MLSKDIFLYVTLIAWYLIACFCTIFVLLFIHNTIVEHLKLIEKIKKIPPGHHKEVEDFIDFILEKKNITSKKSKGRKLGLLRGKMQMSPGFDDPLDDFKEYM